MPDPLAKEKTTSMRALDHLFAIHSKNDFYHQKPNLEERLTAEDRKLKSRPRPYRSREGVNQDGEPIYGITPGFQDSNK